MKKKKWISVICIIGMLFLCSNIDYNNRIYRHAVQGDIDAIYKIMLISEENDTIFPTDTLENFRDTLFKHGHFEYIRHCLLMDFENNKPGDYAPRDKEQHKQHWNQVYARKNKWWDIGVRAGDPQCMFERYKVARAQFLMNKTQEDSLEYMQYLNLCRENLVYEADINEARYSQDPKKWIKAQCHFFFPFLVRNIKQKGFFQGSFHTIFTSIAKFPFEFCWEYLFSKHWWKPIVLVLLLFVICIASLWSPILINNGRLDLVRPVIWGLSLGVVHGVFYFWSDQSINYLWGKTIFCLWLPPYSDGIGAFIPIGINWYIIYKLIRHILKLWQISGPHRMLKICLFFFLFLYTYYITTAALSLCILLWFLVVAAGAGIKSASFVPEILTAKPEEKYYDDEYIEADGLGRLRRNKYGNWEDSNGVQYIKNIDGKIQGPSGEHEITGRYYPDKS